MPINEWSDDILIAELSDEPSFSEDMGVLIRRLESRARAAPVDVVLNLGGVTYLNSSNIAQLLRVRQMVVNAGRRLRICAVGNEVWSVMLITGLDKFFEFNGDVATSLASLQIEG